jgi:hypothetical protein
MSLNLKQDVVPITECDIWYWSAIPDISAMTFKGRDVASNRVPRIFHSLGQEKAAESILP